MAGDEVLRRRKVNNDEAALRGMIEQSEFTGRLKSSPGA
jgi:hypothetical protein